MAVLPVQNTQGICTLNKLSRQQPQFWNLVGKNISKHPLMFCMGWKWCLQLCFENTPKQGHVLYIITDGQW